MRVPSPNHVDSHLVVSRLVPLNSSRNFNVQVPGTPTGLTSPEVGVGMWVAVGVDVGVDVGLGVDVDVGLGVDVGVDGAVGGGVGVPECAPSCVTSMAPTL